MKLGYYIAKLRSKVFHNHEILVKYYRRGGELGRIALSVLI